MNSLLHGVLMRGLKPLREASGLPRVLLLVGGSIVLCFVIMAVFAPLIAPYHFTQYEADGVRFAKQAAPTIEHIFGTTARQTDVLSLTIYGSQTALKVVVVAVFLSALIGVPLGLFAGYAGGWFDRLAVLFTDALFAFPSMLLAIVMAFLLAGPLGGGIATAALSMTVVYVPQYFRVVRNSVLSVREEPFVEAAVVMGAPTRSVIVKYIFPNVIQSVPIIATLNAADAILTLAGLGFLGYGVQPTVAAEWGFELQRAIPDIAAGIWWTGLFPGLAIVILVIGLTLFGEGLNDVLNPIFRRKAVKVPTISAAKLEDTANA